MSTRDPQLALYLKLDSSSAAGKVGDASGDPSAGTITGAVKIAEDPTLGPCAAFGGGFISVRDPFGGAADFTISAWVQPAVLNDGAFHGFIGKQGDAYRKPGMWLTPANGGLHYDSYDTSGTRFGDLLSGFFTQKGEWVHVAWVKEGTTYRFFRNGTLFATRPAPARFFAPSSTDYWIGRVDNFWNGRIARVRIHTRSLSDTEIARQLAEDLGDVEVPLAAVRRTLPISFLLADNDAQPVLVMDDDPAGHKLHLTITNSSREALTLTAPVDPVASATNHHFELRFRPRILLDTSLERIAVVESAAWSCAFQRNRTDGGVSLYLLSKAAVTTPPGERLHVTFTSVRGDPTGGARGTRVELTYQQLRAASDPTTPLVGSASQRLDLVNQRGQRQIPLHVGFTESNVVLNDGSSANKLVLRITNVSSESISLAPIGSQAPTRLILSFDVDDASGSRPWALGTRSQVGAISVSAADSKDGHAAWSVTAPSAESPTPEWILSTPNAAALTPGDVAEITLGNLITSSPTGHTNLYLRYENVPGYWDGEFVLVIEKAPLLTRASRVGIGTANPKSPLTIRGDSTWEELVRFENRSGVSKWHLNQNAPGRPGLNFAESGVADGRLFLEAGGNVGIGTLTPRTGLDTTSRVLSGAANDYPKAQLTMSGGGTVTWTGPGGRLKWTKAFVASSAERGKTFSEGRVDIAQPVTDLPAAQVFDGTPRSANADGVILNAWEALYAVHTVGGGKGAVTLQIVSAAQDFIAPSHWLLVALVNGDDRTVKLGTGAIVAAKSSSAGSSGVPCGAITLWYGDINQIPEGWLLCDGTQGTPDLRDRFVAGAGGRYTPRSTGGADTVTLTAAQMPSHNHTGSVTGGTHHHLLPVWVSPLDVLGGGAQKNPNVGLVNGVVGELSDADLPNQTKWTAFQHKAFTKVDDPLSQHTHTVQPDGGGQAHENRPPYLALCFIMKSF